MHFCPNCGHDLSQYTSGSAPTALPPAGSYNQTKIWKELVAKAAEVKATPPAPETLVLPVVDRIKPFFQKGGPVKTVVHMVLDREVVPHGGVLHQITMTEGRSSLDAQRLEALGYSVVDGKVRMVNDVPVGLSYSAIEYWGGVRQHKRWHLAEPCRIEASRNGDPFFMDDNMIAFGAVWNDVEKMESGLLELLEMFANGFGAERKVIGIPLALDVRPH